MKGLVGLVSLVVLVHGCEAKRGEVAPRDAAPHDAAPDASVLYPAVAEIIDRRCGIERCHVGPIIGGGLPLLRGNDHAELLVDVPSCEYPPMDLVEPFEPEQSWLMVKLTAEFRPQLDPYATYIYFEPAADWDALDRPCTDETDDGTPLFGQRMPATAPNTLTAEELSVVRRWIEAGAPH